MIDAKEVNTVCKLGVARYYEMVLCSKHAPYFILHGLIFYVKNVSVIQD